MERKESKGKEGKGEGGKGNIVPKNVENASRTFNITSSLHPPKPKPVGSFSTMLSRMQAFHKSATVEPSTKSKGKPKAGSFSSSSHIHTQIVNINSIFTS